MRVELVDPPAYSLAYDDALARALTACGADVSLITSTFSYGEAPPPCGYTRAERFYRHTFGPARFGLARPRARRLARAAQHLPDMLCYRHALRGAATPDVVHFQWLTLPRVDLRLLPELPTVLTIHDPLERSRDRRARTGLFGSARASLAAGAFSRVDAVIVHSDYARARVLDQHGLDPACVHVIPHGVLVPDSSHVPDSSQVPLPDGPDHRAQAAVHGLVDDGSPVVLCYGLLRPYKGITTLLAAWHGLTEGQLWIVGRPMMDLRPVLNELPARAQLLPRFVSGAEQRALFERADIVVLPYHTSERFGFSGVLATALGAGKAIVLSDVGGLAEVGAQGAARLVPPGDRSALRETLIELIQDPAERERLATAARSAARRTYAWERIARQTLAVYERVV